LKIRKSGFLVSLLFSALIPCPALADEESSNMQGIKLYRQQKYQEALDAFQKAIDHAASDSDKMTALENMSLVFDAMKMPDQFWQSKHDAWILRHKLEGAEIPTEFDGATQAEAKAKVEAKNAELQKKADAERQKKQQEQEKLKAQQEMIKAQAEAKGAVLKSGLELAKKIQEKDLQFAGMSIKLLANTDKCIACLERNDIAGLGDCKQDIHSLRQEASKTEQEIKSLENTYMNLLRTNRPPGELGKLSDLALQMLQKLLDKEAEMHASFQQRLELSEKSIDCMLSNDLPGMVSCREQSHSLIAVDNKLAQDMKGICLEYAGALRKLNRSAEADILEARAKAFGGN
jgi:hypothetical protein